MHITLSKGFWWHQYSLAKDQSHSLGLIMLDPKTKQTPRLISRSHLKKRRDPTPTYSLRMRNVTLLMCIRCLTLLSSTCKNQCCVCKCFGTYTLCKCKSHNEIYLHSMQVYVYKFFLHLCKCKNNSFIKFYIVRLKNVNVNIFIFIWFYMAL